MFYTTAITRLPAATLADGLTTARLGRPDIQLAREQHRQYCLTLERLGLDLIVLEALDEFPDAHFIEDVAIVWPEFAIITRPGAASRCDEIIHIRSTVEQYREIYAIAPPGTVDGGDVLVIDQQVFVGISTRTNQAGYEQVKAIVEIQGYCCTAVPLATGLHLKSSVNYMGGNGILVTAALADDAAWATFDRTVVPLGEEYAANTLLINEYLLTPDGFPGTLDLIAQTNRSIITLPMSEMMKMDGGLTCLSLRF